VALPDYQPQLASLTKTPPSGDEWLHEIKLDGYRVGCVIASGRVWLISRNGLDWTKTFPEVVAAAEKLGVHDAIIDGELVVLQKDGRTSFEGMQQAVAGGASRSGLVYFAFDLLRLEGVRIDRLPLERRKARLRSLVGRGGSGRLRYTEHFDGRGADVFESACRLGLEGIVSKRRDLPYQPGRRDSWRKTKCVQRGQFVIGGFTNPEGSRAGLGALLVGRYSGTRLTFAGRVGTGFSQAFALDLRRRLDRTVRPQCPFDPLPPVPVVRDAHWVEPTLTCEVTFTEWTAAGVLRHPVFQSLQEPAASSPKPVARRPKPEARHPSPASSPLEDPQRNRKRR
jgi:bifunctional non-homologous end joining protein LigD